MSSRSTIKPKCPIHHCDMIIFCPGCRGAKKSAAKTRTARINGLKGGRPRRRRSG